MSNRIKELREKQAQIVTEARERLDQINASTDEARTKDLETQHDAAMAEHDKLEKQIEREERQAKIEATAAEARAKNRPIPGDGGEGRGQDGGDAPEYREVFHKMICAGGDLSELSAEERSVLRAGIANVGKTEGRAQTVGTTTAGGFTVPTELANFIVKSMKDWGPMYDEEICTIINTTSGNPIKIPTVDDTATTAEKHTEAAALTDDGGKDVAFAQKSLDAYVYDTEFIRFSFELAADSIFSMESLLGALLGERLGRIANRELTVGDGVGDPNGIVVASTLGKTAAAAAAIASDELIDLQHSVNSAYRRSPKTRWMFADTTLAAIRKLKDGQGNYLWQMGDIKTGAPATLLNHPYSINDDVPAIATGAKPIVFGDFGKYFVRKVGSPVIGVLRERFWPDLGIAGLIRFDGELGDTAAVKHLIMA